MTTWLLVWDSHDPGDLNPTIKTGAELREFFQKGGRPEDVTVSRIVAHGEIRGVTPIPEGAGWVLDDGVEKEGI